MHNGRKETDEHLDGIVSFDIRFQLHNKPVGINAKIASHRALITRTARRKPCNRTNRPTEHPFAVNWSNYGAIVVLCSLLKILCQS